MWEKAVYQTPYRCRWRIQKGISFRITRGNVHDSKKFCPMIKEASQKYRIDKVYADKAHDDWHYLRSKPQLLQKFALPWLKLLHLEHWCWLLESSSKLWRKPFIMISRVSKSCWVRSSISSILFFITVLVLSSSNNNTTLVNKSSFVE